MNPLHPTPESDDSGGPVDDGTDGTDVARDDAADTPLLSLLAAALELTDPLPDHVQAAAISAHAWRNIDQELAELVFDSAHELTGVRDRTASRQLTFRSDTIEVEVMILDAAERRLVGQLVPARATTVTLENTESEARHEQASDEHGRFTFDHLPAGPVRFNIAPRGEATPITTDWIML
ncbi:hypothetical protein BH24ACT5_BH24ACT5_10270 [soil metagenome]